jgi:hypothetical protein
MALVTPRAQRPKAANDWARYTGRDGPIVLIIIRYYSIVFRRLRSRRLHRMHVGVFFASFLLVESEYLRTRAVYALVTYQERT